jgi:hypothetical protein
MSLVTVRMTRAEVAQLLDYAHFAHPRAHVPETGWYYGHPEQFQRRHESIVNCLELALWESAPSEAKAMQTIRESDDAR